MPNIQLSGLRDIHLPEAVSWWPPAPGWWGVLVLGLLAIAMLFLIRAWRKRRRLRNSAILEVQRVCETFEQHHDNLRLIRELSVLLRRISISYFPRADVASLTGEQWLRFLDSCGSMTENDQGFLHGPGQILDSGPYQARLDIDSQALIVLCRRWVKSLPVKAATV